MGRGSWHRPEVVGEAGLCFGGAGMLLNGPGRLQTAATDIGCSAGGRRVPWITQDQDSWLSGCS